MGSYSVVGNKKLSEFKRLVESAQYALKFGVSKSLNKK